MLRKLLLIKQKTTTKQKNRKKAQNNLKILYSRYLKNWTGIVVGKSVKGTLKSKQSQPSPPTLATESYGYALTGRVECLSANHPPVAPLRLQAYRDTAHSLGYPLAVVSLHGPMAARQQGGDMVRTLDIAGLRVVKTKSSETGSLLRHRDIPHTAHTLLPTPQKIKKVLYCSKQLYIKTKDVLEEGGVPLLLQW